MSRHDPTSYLESPSSEIRARLFLVGCPRSGTTLLQSLLCAHPHVFSVPESHFYSKLPSSNRILRRLGIARRDAPERFATMLSSLGLPPAQPRALFVRSYLLRLVEALDKATVASGKTVWLEKTPRHLHYLPSITRTLPEAKFIHLVRSGPDVVASLYEVTHKHPQVWGGARSVDDCVDRWIKDVELSHSYQGHPNHLIVRYEALTENPEACLRTLFAFIGLPFSKSAQTDYRHASKRIVAPGEAWKKSVQRDIKPLSNHKFAQLFPPEQQAYILGRTRPHESSRS